MSFAVRRAGCALISMLAVLAIAAPAAVAAPEGKAVAVSSLANGAKRIKYRVGPFNVVPGQNSIGYDIVRERPQVDGYITRIRPDVSGRPRAGRGCHPSPSRGLGEPVTRWSHSGLPRGALLRRG